MACLTYDTGDAAGAETWREANAQLGHETGHAELIGWSHGIAARMVLTSNRPAEAADHAVAGQDMDGTSCLAVQLAAKQARASDVLGGSRWR